jgi:hypothetical protein
MTGRFLRSVESGGGRHRNRTLDAIFEMNFPIVDDVAELVLLLLDLHEQFRFELFDPVQQRRSLSFI